MSLSTNANFLPVCIRTRIPKIYQKQPIISRLISRYDLTVNIAAALLGNYHRNCGWFDLELLLGSPQNVEACLAYLQALNIDVFQLTLKNLLKARIKKSQRDNISEIDVPIEQIHTITEDEPENDLIEAGQATQTKVQVCIPKHYRAQPVISGLVSPEPPGCLEALRLQTREERRHERF